MRENDIFGVKPFSELLEIIKEEINISLEKILKEYKVEEICSIRQDKKMIKE